MSISPRDDRFEWVTVKQFAEHRGVSERTVRYWIKRRLLEAERTIETGTYRGRWRIKVPRAS